MTLEGVDKCPQHSTSLLKHKIRGNDVARTPF